jgi:hypothetical protein
MKNVSLSDAELTAYSGEHLLYELEYFQLTARLLHEEKRGEMRSILIESFVIHLRNLIDFFFTPETHNDDVVATDFCGGWNEPISSTLKTARERANKELTHLTLGRKSGLHPDKPWDVAGLFQEVSAVAKTFSGRASTEKLSPHVGKWLNLSHADVLAVDGAMAPSTNSTATTATVSWNPTRI